MFPDRWKERSICEENENIWKRIPGEKLPKFVGEMETFYWQVSMAGNNWFGGGGVMTMSEQFFSVGDVFLPSLGIQTVKA